MSCRVGNSRSSTRGGLPIRCLLSLLVLLANDNVSDAEDWPQWHGLRGEGRSVEENLPIRWSADSAAVRWKTAIPGEGVSSPVVSRGRVYLTTAYEGEQRNPWDALAARCVLGAALAALLLMGWHGWKRCCAASYLPREGGRISIRAGMLGMLTVAVCAVITLILAKPTWFWQFPDPWSRNVRAAELPFVETLKLRPVVAIVAGSLTLVFAALVMQERRQAPAAGLSQAGPPFLARWMTFMTACFTLAALVAAALVNWHPAWFWQAGQPWLVWLITGGLALLLVAAGIGWLAERQPCRWLGVVAGLGLAFSLFWYAPLDEVNFSQDLRIRLGTLAPGCLLLVGYALLSWLARRNGWASTPSSVWLPAFLAVAGLGLFWRSYYLQPEAGMLRVVLCLDSRTGDVLWETPVFVAPTEKKHSLNTFATPTPTTDGERVYAAFGAGVAALDRNGRVLWIVRDPEYSHSTRYGMGSSPVLAGDLLIVFQDREWLGHGTMEDADERQRPSSLIALDKHTGRERWRASPAFAHDSYMSPLIWSRGGQPEVVVATWKTLAGFDLATGALRWSHAYPMKQIVPSLVVHEDMIIASGGNEYPREMVAVSLAAGAEEPRTIWSSKTGAPLMSTPVCWDGLLFSVTAVGMLYCREATTGEICWSRRLHGRFLASLVAGDGKIYALNDDGVTFVLAATRTENLLATNRLEEPCSATPAIAEGCLFVRTARHLYCIAGGT